MSFLSEIPTRTATSIQSKLYIKDTNGKWVDFSDPHESRGINALQSMGSISNKLEQNWGALITTIQNVTLDNSSGFFNKPFPSTLKTVDGATAVFATSKNKKRTILRGRECKVTVQIGIPEVSHIATSDSGSIKWGTMDHWQEVVLGHFFIDDEEPDYSRKMYTLKLISMDGRLKEKDASGVTYGYGYYSFAPTSFLLEELLYSEFNSLPDSYNIDKAPFTESIDGTEAVALLGKPPVWTGSGWVDSSLYCRDMGFYNVGSTGSRLYLALDDELWWYDPDTGTYTQIGATGEPDRPIKKMVYDSGDDCLYLFCWPDERFETYMPYPEWETAGGDHAFYGWGLKLYKFTAPDTITEHLSSSSLYNFSASVLHRVIEAYDATLYYVYTGHIKPSGTDTYNGENFLIPFPQDVHFGISYADSMYVHLHNKVDGTGDWDDDLTGDGRDMWDTDGTEDNMKMFGHANRGWSTISAADTYGTLRCSPISYFVGQDYNFPLYPIAERSSDSSRYLYGLEFTWFLESALSSRYNSYAEDINGSGNNQWTRSWYKLWRVKMSDGSNKQTVDFPATGSVPLCAGENGSSGDMIMFTLLLNSGHTEAQVQALSVDLTASSLAFSSSNTCQTIAGGEEPKTPVSFLCYSDNDGSSADRWVMVWFDRGTNGEPDQGRYYVTHGALTNLFSSSDFFSTQTVKLSSKSPFLGLTEDGLTGEIFVYEYGAGRVHHIAKDGTLTTVNQSPISPDESGLVAGLAVNPGRTASTYDIYGITSPTHRVETHNNPVSGNYSLWRFSKYLSDIVQLADFSDLTKYDAIQKLSQSKDHLAFFDRHGSFHYLPRSYTLGTADWKLGINEGDSNIVAIKKLNYGYSKVFNVVKIQPYSITFKAPDTNALTLIPRGDKNSEQKDPNDIPFVDYIITQRDKAAKKIIAYCMVGGSTTDGVSRWKYTVVDNDVEAIVDGLHGSSATVISLRSIFGGSESSDGIKPGHVATIYDPENETPVTRFISSVSTSADTITLSSSFGFEIPDGTTVIISRGFNVGSSAGQLMEFSDSGVTKVSEGVFPGATSLQVDSVRSLSIGTIITFGSDINEYRITQIDTSDRLIYFDRVGVAGTGLVNAVTINSRVRAYYSPKSSAGSEIGGSNVFISWQAGAGTEEVDYSKTFVPGDRLQIECPGTSLEEESTSMQVIVDNTSKGQFGKLELDISNRFLTRPMAKELAKRLVKFYAYPRFRVSISTPLLPEIDIVNTNGDLTQVDLYSSELFPTHEDQKESFLIEAIQHDLNNGLTTLDLVSVEAY